MEFITTLEKAKSTGKKRNFIQSIEFIMNFTRIDFNKPDQRINLEVALPAGKGKETSVGIIAGDEIVIEAKKYATVLIKKEEIGDIAKDKKKLKAIVDKCDFFLCQTDLMPLIGKSFGQVMGPKGKMPKPVPPNAKLDVMINRFKNIANMKCKGKFLPTLQTVIGSEEMTNEDLNKNALAVYNAVREKLPGKEANIRSMFIKTSMGPAVKVESEWSGKKKK